MHLTQTGGRRLPISREVWSRSFGLRPVNRPMGTFMEAVMYLKLLAAMLAIAFMAGCNTMEGAGKDVKSVGTSLENSADKHKP